MCSAPCVSLLGCSPPTPSANQFAQWGQDDESERARGPFQLNGLCAGIVGHSHGGNLCWGRLAGAGSDRSGNQRLLGSVLLGGTALQDALVPIFAVAGSKVFSLGVSGGVFTSAEAEELAGTITASGVGFIASVMILAVTTAVLGGHGRLRCR